ncbi:MAG: FkbM family methyltransferase [bacterium]
MLKKFFILLREYKLAKILLQMRFEGYLFETGWINSVKLKMPINKENKPIPWFSFSFNDFIETRLNKTLKVFEYGSGNSTLYIAPKVNSIKSIEYDKNWMNYLKKNAPHNSEIIYCSYDNNNKNGEYCRIINSTNEKYDIIIIDGRDRVNCCKNSIHNLSPFGVIIFDDSHEAKYEPIFNFLKDQSFKHIDFSGLGSGYIHKKRTTLFYRSNNCFNI